jgi:hypothetical protein
MKYFSILLFFNLSICLAQKSESPKMISEKLPAYESSDSRNVMRSIARSSDFDRFQVVIFNKKEYTMKEVKKILDTIGKEYTFDIKLDSVSNKKALIIKKRT